MEKFPDSQNSIGFSFDNPLSGIETDALATEADLGYLLHLTGLITDYDTITYFPGGETQSSILFTLSDGLISISDFSVDVAGTPISTKKLITFFVNDPHNPNRQSVFDIDMELTPGGSLSICVGDYGIRDTASQNEFSTVQADIPENTYILGTSLTRRVAKSLQLLTHSRLKQ